MKDINTLNQMNMDELATEYLLYRPWDDSEIMWLPYGITEWEKFWSRVKGFWIQFNDDKLNIYFVTVDEFNHLMNSFEKGKPISIGSTMYNTREFKSITITEIDFIMEGIK